ncbi:MAG: hypothetical protein Q8K65_03895 [Alphaproteobacteria bacterium]|nr:hypothetical protein [Alphaproteobacteria bacterium]
MRLKVLVPVFVLAVVFAGSLSLAVRADLAVPEPPPEQAQVAPQTSAPEATQIPVPAQTPAPELPMDDQMRRAKAAYEAATKNLTPEQLAELEALEARFAASMEVDMKIFHRSAEMEHCLTHDGFFKADKSRHVKAFVAWRKGLKDEQADLWNAHRVERSKARYISIVVLNEYYIYQGKMLKMIGMALARQQMQAGAFKETDCELLAKTLAAGE